MLAPVRVICGPLLAAFLLMAAFVAVAPAADPPEVSALKKAGVDGKYGNLLAIIRVPGDKKEYGEFKDYGDYDGTEWGRYKGLPKGKWVYVYPHWYIWRDEGKGLPGTIRMDKATADGKYANLLAVIHMPGDKKEYGDFKDYGEFDGNEWGPYKGLPKGKWVYVFPHWYIWEREVK